MEIGRGIASARASYAWRDDYETVTTNPSHTSVDSFGILDASLSYDIEGWKVSVYGRNITDEDYYTHAFMVGLQFDPAPRDPPSLWSFAIPREPRMWGIELTKSWE